MSYDLVVFRKWKDNGDVIALFPEIPADIHGYYCDSYEHVGQHGGADYYGVVRQTRLARPEEFASLARELTMIGYAIRPIRRASACHHQRRRVAARSTE
jgi:hypothetical protein